MLGRKNRAFGHFEHLDVGFRKADNFGEYIIADSTSLKIEIASTHPCCSNFFQAVLTETLLPTGILRVGFHPNEGTLPVKEDLSKAACAWRNPQG